ncbi:MAG: hypothetical protein GQ576_00150 [Methanococcoides sp.]|nr:hypothetical protein [Methanococcoides sp.]
MRYAIMNLSMYGYGTVRTINGMAVTVPSNACTIVMSNEEFSMFLRSEIDPNNEESFL